MRAGTGSVSVARRNGDSNAEPELRAYLLEQAVDFRKLMANTLVGHSIESGQFAWDQCSGPVDALAAGRPYRFHGFELPDDHPRRARGVRLDLDFEIGADDVLREIAPVPSIHPEPVRRSNGRLSR